MILSIIVPVYNVESYLKECLDSILNQDLNSDDFEIILINDGSTDLSGRICDDYSSKHSNIHVIHQENKGLSSARNRGINVAKGTYIQFVDSDDYLTPNTIGRLIKLVEKEKLDVLRFNYQNVDSHNNVFESNKMPKKYVDYSEDICDGEKFLNERLGSACYAIQFILRTSLVLKPGNKFSEGIYFEDVEWTPRILLQAKRIKSTKTIVYNYRYRTDSITREVNMVKKQKFLRDRLIIINNLLAIKERTTDKRWFDSMIAQMAISIIQDTAQFFYKDRKKNIQALKSMNLFPLSTFHATDSATNKIKIANISPYLLCAAIHYKRSL